MSGRDAEERADAARVRARLEAYYGRYYGGTLGIPGWRELVAVRLDDVAYERERLTRLELALGRSVAGARLLNVGCGTGGGQAAGPRPGGPARGGAGRGGGGGHGPPPRPRAGPFRPPPAVSPPAG